MNQQDHTAGESGHILVVDDDDLILDLISSCLTSADYMVLTASNGEDALKILAQSKCDLVITDIRMPHGDGIDLSNVLRRDHPELKIIVMSGDDLPLRFLEASETSGLVTLHKPFELDTLLSTVKATLDCCQPGLASGPPSRSTGTPL